jgi:hypothetical protein
MLGLATFFWAGRRMEVSMETRLTGQSVNQIWAAREHIPPGSCPAEEFILEMTSNTFVK